MPNILVRLLFNTIAALVAAYLLKGVHLQDVATALVVAIVLALLNTFIKPLLVILTIPITVFTLGLFLIVINVLIIKWTADLVDGFEVENWFWALLFSIVVSLVSTILENLFGTRKKPE
jgi:putative membrane protein